MVDGSDLVLIAIKRYSLKMALGSATSLIEGMLVSGYLVS
jgi:hypothetical protein